MNAVEETLINIVKHVEEHGNFLINKDSAQHLTLGWQCTKTNQIWLIRLADIKKFTSEDLFFYNMFIEHIINPHGRLKLITLIKDLGRYKKLKAFL